MDEVDKFKMDSIVAQLRKDLPSHTEEERAKYLDLLEIMLDDQMIGDLEINGGKENFTLFVDKYADKLLAWKSQKS